MTDCDWFELTRTGTGVRRFARVVNGKIETKQEPADA